MLRQRRREIQERARVEHPVLGQVSQRSEEAGDCPEPRETESVLVSYGIHSGKHPVVGKTVAQAREDLRHEMNIDPGAIAIINGYKVEDESSRVISSVDELLAFVKETSVRGAVGRC